MTQGLLIDAPMISNRTVGFGRKLMFKDSFQTQSTASTSVLSLTQTFKIIRVAKYYNLKIDESGNSILYYIPAAVLAQNGRVPVVVDHAEYIRCLDCNSQLPLNRTQFLNSDDSYVNIFEIIFSAHTHECKRRTDVSRSQTGALKFPPDWKNLDQGSGISAMSLEAHAQGLSSNERGLLAEPNEYMPPTESVVTEHYPSVVEPRNCILYYFFIQVVLLLFCSASCSPTCSQFVIILDEFFLLIHL